jgi:hypothetical protein
VADKDFLVKNGLVVANGNIAVSGTVDGRDIAADGTKLDGIESGATADQTASEILTAIKTVDGASSGLDADLLDGQHGSYYLDWTNTTNKPDPVITLAGDLSGSVTLTDLASGTLTATIVANSVALGTDTTGNYVASITNGSYITGGDGGSEGAALTLAVDAATAATASKVVARDASGNFSANTITAALSGNATTATTLQTARTIAISGDVTGTATSFNGSSNITISSAITADSIVNADINSAAAIADTKLATISTAGKVLNSATTATSANTASAIVARDASGNFTAGTITAALSGNATTATTLQTARTITLSGDVGGSASFNGSADVTITTTVQPNSVALGTDTTGNYVANVTGGTGVTITGTAGEGWTPTVAIGQAVGTTSDVEFRNLVLSGNLTINGTTTTVSATELAIEDNLIYLNANSTITNPDIGIVGNYNDGTYAHTGVFRDATDGRWKFFKGYVPEPGQTIDTANNTFQYADVQANTFYGALSGNATTATTLETARTIAISGDVTGTATSFNGSANITISAGITANTIIDADINTAAAITDTKLATISTAGKVSNSATTATNLNTASAIVARDASGNFSAGTITAALSGNATTATTLATGRTISLTGDVTYTSGSFDGSGNVTGTATLANSGVTANTYGSSTAIPVITVDAKGRITSATTSAITVGDGTLTLGVSGVGLSGSQTFTANQGTNATFTVTSNATNSNTPSTIVSRDASGNFSANTITANLVGNASTVTNGALTTGTLAQFAATTSAQLAGVISDETGSGALVFGTSPSFTSGINAASTTMALFDTTATTVNAFGAATAFNLGYDSTASSTTSIAAGAVGSGNIKTINIGTLGASGSITFVNIGSATAGAVGNTVINSSSLIVPGNLAVGANIAATTGPILTLGALAGGGSGYTNGTHTNQTLTGGTGFYALGTVTVALGVVTSVTLTWGGHRYSVGDVLTVQSLTTALPTTATTGNGTTATISFAAQPAPPFEVGSQVIVGGVTPTGYNGIYTVTACTTTSVSYANATTGAQTVAGNVKMNAALTSATIPVNTIQGADIYVNSYSSDSIGARIRLEANDTSTSAGQEYGAIAFAGRDASAQGSGDLALIRGVGVGTAGGGELQFWTAPNGATPTISAVITSGGNFRLYNSAGTFYSEFSNSPTANRTVTVPDSTFTIAGTNIAQTFSGNQTFSGQIISTDPWDAATGAGQIYLNGTTGNRIDWTTAGLAAPAFTTRSAGTKLVLYPAIGASSADYAIGMESSNMWHSVASTGAGFKWYGGTTQAAHLTGAGVFTVPRIELTSTTDGSLTSTDHALQIGLTSGANIIVDNNEIIARNNGVASSLSLNITGGAVNIGAATSLIDLRGTTQALGINPAANTTYDLGTTTMRWNLMYGTATAARYADLAEKYLADDDYPVGTVISVGGEAEVTATTIETAHSIVGVVSEKPAYLMNDCLEGGTAIALRGRVPVLVTGVVNKGDRLTASRKPGYAIADNSATRSFAIALHDSNESEIVEAIIL